MEYYEYTLDKKYLKEKILPIFAGAVRFYLCVLEELDGYKMLLSSTSPENSFTYDGKKSAVAETTEMSMAIVRELFGNYVKACEILGEDDDLLKRVKEEIPKLLPICVGKDGRVLEWYGEKEEREINHRHISHAYSLFPGNAVTLEKTPQLAEAIEKSIATRGENSGMGWTLSWKSCCYSRLRDGETAFKFIKKQMIPKMENGKYNLNYFGTYPNMTNACPPFQIDGSFGGTRAVLEMLMQSEVDQLHIAPALPKEIENVDVKGIKAKGKRTVTFIVENGDVVYCKIVGSKPEKITVKGIDKTEKFVQIKGGWIYNK
jgi:alpha-L-fucosidase 2